MIGWQDGWMYVSTVSVASHRYRLRSTVSAVYVLPRTRARYGERGFFYSGPAAWNTLPSDLHDITDTSAFRKQLKGVLFDHAYHWLIVGARGRVAAPYKFCVDLIDYEMEGLKLKCRPQLNSKIVVEKDLRSLHLNKESTVVYTTQRRVLKLNWTSVSLVAAHCSHCGLMAVRAFWINSCKIGLMS